MVILSKSTRIVYKLSNQNAVSNGYSVQIGCFYKLSNQNAASNGYSVQIGCFYKLFNQNAVYNGYSVLIGCFYKLSNQNAVYNGYSVLIGCFYKLSNQNAVYNGYSVYIGCFYKLSNQNAVYNDIPFWLDVFSIKSTKLILEIFMIIGPCCSNGFECHLRVPLVEQELPTLPEHLSSPQVFSGVPVTRSLVLYVCFVDRCLSLCTFGHCVVCPCSIYGFWLPFWYLQTLLTGQSKSDFVFNKHWIYEQILL